MNNGMAVYTVSEVSASRGVIDEGFEGLGDVLSLRGRETVWPD
jgi:hypothetical protein